jgi:hypothetical protein
MKGFREFFLDFDNIYEGREIILFMIGLLKVSHQMVNLVGFSWVEDMQENLVQNNQDKLQNRSVVLAR